mmetsp:Transcript_3379/g.6481  ORF Transcript_3379/g.6481 Transcript_3379/m.6481 type:complete len:308 (-) Transcript_3379:95-1018(-)
MRPARFHSITGNLGAAALHGARVVRFGLLASFVVHGGLVSKHGNILDRATHSSGRGDIGARALAVHRGLNAVKRCKSKLGRRILGSRGRGRVCGGSIGQLGADSYALSTADLVQMVPLALKTITDVAVVVGAHLRNLFLTAASKVGKFVLYGSNGRLAASGLHLVEHRAVYGGYTQLGSLAHGTHALGLNTLETGKVLAKVTEELHVKRHAAVVFVLLQVLFNVVKGFGLVLQKEALELVLNIFGRCRLLCAHCACVVSRLRVPFAVVGGEATSDRAAVKRRAHGREARAHGANRRCKRAHGALVVL